MENLAKLGYGYHSAKIAVRIIRIWDSFSVNTYYEAATNFILLDAKVRNPSNLVMFGITKSY